MPLLLAAISVTGIPLAGRGLAEETSDGKVRVVFGGDVMLDGGPGHAVANGIDPFGHVAPLLADAELAVCNLECAGADAVIGGHAHVTQTVDVYRGRPIVYSLGNFVFDYFPEAPPVWTGWIVRLTFSKTSPVELETFAVELDPAGIPRLTPGEKADGH